MRFTAGSLLSSFHSSLLMGIHTPKREEKWLNWAQKGAAGSSDPTSSEPPGLVEKLLGAGSGCWVLGAGQASSKAVLLQSHCPHCHVPQSC